MVLVAKTLLVHESMRLGSSLSLLVLLWTKETLQQEDEEYCRLCGAESNVLTLPDNRLPFLEGSPTCSEVDQYVGIFFPVGSANCTEAQLGLYTLCGCQEGDQEDEEEDEPEGDEGVVDTVLTDPSECDELKCTSLGYFGGYGCWSLDFGPDPYSCKDGYQGVPLQLVPPTVNTDNPLYGGTFYYYTCCPPNTNATLVSVSGLPECSPDPFICIDTNNDCIADGPVEPKTCNDPHYRYPNKNGWKVYFDSWWYSQYKCCASPPANQRLRIFWPELTRFLLGLTATVVSGSLMLGILIAPKIRKQAFNLYILLLTIPDVVLQLFSTAIMAGRTVAGRYTHHHCEIMVSTTVFSFFSNVWLNSVILYELQILLVKSKRRERARPPSTLRVMKQTLVIYLLGVAAGIYGVYLTCKKHRTKLEEKGRYERVLLIATLVFYLLPYLHLIYVCFRVWRGNLLPRNGRTRTLGFFFLRVIVLFMTIWAVEIVLSNFERRNISNLEGVFYVNQYLRSIGSIINTWLSLLKPDLRKAFTNFWHCNWKADYDSDSFDRKARSSKFFAAASEYFRFFRNRSSEEPSGNSAASSSSARDSSSNRQTTDGVLADESGKESRKIASEHEIEFHRESQIEEEEQAPSTLFDTAIPNSIWCQEDDWGQQGGSSNGGLSDAEEAL